MAIERHIFDAPDRVDVGAMTLAVYRAGPALSEATKPPVVLMHGFPELAFSWRHQITALGDAGYPVFCPDMPGYGHSDKPPEVEAYSIENLAKAMTGLLDHYGIEKAVFIGHDWGALLLWSLPFECPDRLLGCGGLNVGYVHSYPVDPIHLFQKAFGNDMYIVRFQQGTEDEDYLNVHAERSLRYFFRKSGGQVASQTLRQLEAKLALTLAIRQPPSDWGGQPVFTEEEFAVYRDAFEMGGFRGALNYYRNFTVNHKRRLAQLAAGWQGPHPWPCLMITADKDGACPPHLADGMAESWANLTRHDLIGCGHWSMQEQPDRINDMILSWLEKNF